jgi:hypothetical protein
MSETLAFVCEAHASDTRIVIATTDHTMALACAGKFIFESAIRAKGDSDADSKKKTIFFTELSFPYVSTRIEVVKTEEVW